MCNKYVDTDDDEAAIPKGLATDDVVAVVKTKIHPKTITKTTPTPSGLVTTHPHKSAAIQPEHRRQRKTQTERFLRRRHVVHMGRKNHHRRLHRRHIAIIIVIIIIIPPRPTSGVL